MFKWGRRNLLLNVSSWRKKASGCRSRLEKSLIYFDQIFPLRLFLYNPGWFRILVRALLIWIISNIDQNVILLGVINWISFRNYLWSTGLISQELAWQNSAFHVFAEDLSLVLNIPSRFLSTYLNFLVRLPWRIFFEIHFKNIIEK